MRHRLLGYGGALVTVAIAFGGCGGDDSPGSGGSGGASSANPNGGAGTGGTPSTSTESTGGSGGSNGGGGGAGGSAPTGTPFAYIGCGDGKIRVFGFDAGTGALTPIDTTDAGATPSFLAFTSDHRFVYAVDEGQSMLRAFSIDHATGKLTALNAASSNGNDPAHVAVDKAGKFVFGTNYGAGSVTTYRLGADGKIGAVVGTMMTGSEAHELVFDAAGKFAFVPNKGSDYVAQFAFDAASGALTPNAAAHVAFAAGSGPRHLAFHPKADFAYVVDELDSTMVALSYDATKGQLTKLQDPASTLPDDFHASNTGAEIAFGKSGKFLYASNRGHDSIVTFSVDAATGKAKRIGWTPTGGKTPRHFSVEPSGAVMLVANQDSDNVVTFAIDPTSGALTQLLVTDAPKPGYAGVIYLDP